MEYLVCGKIAKVVLKRVDDISKSESEIYSQIEIVNHESPSEQIDIEVNDKPSHSNTAIHQIEREKQNDGFAELQLAINNSIKQEPTLEEAPTTTQMVTVDNSSQEQCSTVFSPTEEDFSQQHYLIPGYNLILIKEEDSQEGEEITEEVEFGTVQSEAEMWPSISGTANATEVGGLNAHPVSPVEECTEPSVASKETKLYSCDDCGYKTPWLSTLKRHIRRHTKEKPFCCEICDFTCADSGTLKNHIRIHTGEKPFSCDHCSFKCVTSSHLKVHIRRSHTGEKPFCCESCDYKSYTLAYLKRHIRKHTGEKPFSCNFCDYKCDTPAYLKVHIRTRHTGEKPFSCDICDMKFAISSYLKLHLRTHTGEKPFSCNFCDYKCASSAYLRVHIRTHTGVNPFSCEFCDYKCSRKIVLKSHLRTHTGENPFSCDLCDYKCSKPDYLKLHIIRTHTGEKPFSCKLL